MMGIRNKSVALIATLLLSLMGTFVIPRVSASSTHRIILPFHTSWENEQPLGRTNSVDFSKDFYGYYGPTDPLPPELGWRYNEMSPPLEVFGYEFGGRQLMSAGYFSSSNSYAYFSLFDQTSDTDFGPPFKLKERTFINIWYYHYQFADCMIDAQIYNQRTGQWSSLRDFTYDSKYIVDQNGVRLHPAWRYNDAIGSWEFACFDLSIIWNSDPGNWYITKIWVAFDNSVDGTTGQARTYFDLLYISYSVYDKRSHTENGDNAWASGSIVAWDHFLRNDGYYDLWLKATCLGFDNGRWPVFIGSVPNTPQVLKIASINYADAQVQNDPKPAGSNLQQIDYSQPPAAVQKLVYDSLIAIFDIPTCGGATVFQLAMDVWGLLSSPEPRPFYQWPFVNSTWIPDYHPERAIGEVYILIPGLSPYTTSITVTFSVDFGYWTNGPYYPMRVTTETISVPVTIEWSSQPDPLPNSDPPSVAITYPSNDQSFRPEATFTASANVYPPSRYLLNPQTINGQTGYVFTRLTDASGVPVGGYDWRSMQCSQKLTETDDEGGTFTYTYNLVGLPTNAYYYIYVQTQGTNAASQTASVRIYYYNHPPDTPPAPSGGNLAYVGHSYSCTTSTRDPDGDDVRYEFDWNDNSPNTITDLHPSNETVSSSHVWNVGGNYSIRVKAKDPYPGGESGWSQPLNVTVDTPPNAPSQARGDTCEHVYVTYSYSTNTTDPDGDNVLYKFYWTGDGTDLTGWYPSGANATMSHMWSRPARYEVWVCAQDTYGAWSESWSLPLIVNITQNDAGSGGDAGNSFNDATYVSWGTPTYWGTLYVSNPTNANDYYKYYVYSGQTMYASMTPPTGVNFDLELYNPAGVLKAGSYKGANQTDEVSYTADSSGYWRIRINTTGGEGQYSFFWGSAPPGGEGQPCPTLSAWNGTAYVDEGIMNIHNPSGEDVLHEALVKVKDVSISDYRAAFRLREGWPGLNFSESVIDQVKLYAVDSYGNRYLCPLINATHSRLGNVWLQLLFSDDWKTSLLLLETIDLTFIVPYQNIQSYVFVIEGCNQYKQ